MKLFAQVIFPLASVCFLAQCSSGGDGSVSLKVKVLGDSRHSQIHVARDVQTESMSFTPTSFKLPVMKISISKLDGTEEKIIYSCPESTEAACLVDLASQTELDAITTAAQGVAVPAGTYDVISLHTCADGSSGSTSTIAKITGSGTGPVGGTWYTDATSVVTIGSGTANETEVGNWSCSTKNVVVKDGITVGKDALTLTVVVDNFMGAVFGSAVSGGMGGCKVSGGGGSGNGLCVTYPALMAYVGTGTATTKRYSIAHDRTGDPTTDASANALIIVAMTDTGTPLMAYGRTYFTTSSQVVAANTHDSSVTNTHYKIDFGGPTYVTETNFQSFTVNSDGTVAFYQGGSADDFAAKFSALDVTATSSTGTVKSRDEAYSWHYLATLIP